MSFDLSVWDAETSLTVAEAGELYRKLCAFARCRLLVRPMAYHIGVGIPLKLNFLLALLTGAAVCTSQTVARPKILGVAHIGLETNDIKAADEFYGHQL